MPSASRNFATALGPLLLAALLLGGCGGGKQSAATTKPTGTQKTGAQSTVPTTGSCTVVSAPPGTSNHKEPKPTEVLAMGKRYDVTMQTNCGSFTIRIDQAESPHAAASFVGLVRRGFFNRTVFHRIVPGFVIQGGDPTGTGTGGPGYTTVDTPPAGAAYTRGVVAMAKTSAQPAGTAGSQFFIVTVKDAGLPPDYAIIGKVTRGLNVVERIGRHGNAAQKPTMVIEIEQATVSVK